MIKTQPSSSSLLDFNKSPTYGLLNSWQTQYRFIITIRTRTTALRDNKRDSGEHRHRWRKHLVWLTYAVNTFTRPEPTVNRQTVVPPTRPLRDDAFHRVTSVGTTVLYVCTRGNGHVNRAHLGSRPAYARYLFAFFPDGYIFFLFLTTPQGDRVGKSVSPISRVACSKFRENSVWKHGRHESS